MKQYAATATELRQTLTDSGIKPFMWQGFEPVCKTGIGYGTCHTSIDYTETRLTIDPVGSGYEWELTIKKNVRYW